MRLKLVAALAVAFCLSASSAPFAQEASRPPLTPANIDDIAKLLMLEDTRHLDEATLGTLLKSTHPEVRRRAVLAVGRIAPKALPTAADSPERGRALLESLHAEKDTDILATVAFSTGQLKLPASVPWLAEVLLAPKTPQDVAKEAACALGKIRGADARAALAKYLTETPLTSPASVVGEALLSIGRWTTVEDIAPIVRWTTAKDVEVRWRATWALFRPKDPAAIPALLKLAADPSPDVRFWAVRGLIPAVVDKTTVDRAQVSAVLRAAVKDADRRVQTEAIRALVLYDDDASFETVMGALESADTWLSVSAAEQLARFKDRAAVIVPKLVAASAAGTPMALRVTALTPLAALGPEQAADLAEALVRQPASAYARTTAIGALQRMGAPGKAKLDALAADPATKDLIPAQPAGGRGTGARGGQAAARSTLTIDDYRAIVNRWIVPDYNGAPRPHAVWETSKGDVEIELYPGDAPLGMEYFLASIASGSIFGTQFTRVVPNFVAQQQTIPGAPILRDEVNRHGLTRGNLAWASGGLDTGRPGYTLGNTPQPHNEGDFTALGHVVNGMDVVDRLELGDKVLAARMIK
jgi:HEAT repeat protein/cyclophilin family peptidyl-prolyl cis-trans isomerase